MPIRFTFYLIVSIAMLVLPAAAHVGGGIVVGPDGNIYFVHTKRSQVMQMTPDGVVNVLAHGVFGTGERRQSRFPQPHHLAIDDEGALYVAGDSGDGLWKITPDGGSSYYWPPQPHWQTLSIGVLGDPFTIDASGNIYTVNHPTTEGPDRAEDPQHAQILKTSMDMRIEVLAGGDRGFADGVEGEARFGDLFKATLQMGPGGNLYVSEPYALRLVTPEGKVSTLAGSSTPGFVDGPGEEARFDQITGISVTPEGIVYIADAMNQRIRKLGTDGVVTTLAGSGQRGARDGPPDAASFFWLVGIAVDKAGTLYAMEQTSKDSYAFAIRKITPDGTVSTLALFSE